MLTEMNNECLYDVPKNNGDIFSTGPNGLYKSNKDKRKALVLDNISWTRIGSLMSLRDRPLPRTPTDNIDGPCPTPKSPATPSQSPWGTPRSSPRSERRSGGGGPHMSIKQWLTALDLYEAYESTFSQFFGVEELLNHSEADIRDLGVKHSAHRARIMSSLTALKAKYKGGTLVKKRSLRHSVAVDGGKQVRNIQDTADLKVVTESSQSKSLCNLIMEPTADPGVDAATLRKALEWELSLDARDLRSHAWYHGAIPRHRAEEIVQHEGEFLVRDCTSQPGNYVLTCRTKVQPLHFVINKVMIQPDTVYERVQYTFEDDLYDTVPDLITFYVGSGKPISAASGARIQNPRNRMYPLSFYAAKYPSTGVGHGYGVGGGSGTHSRIVSPVGAPSPPFRYSTQHKPPSCSPTRMGRDAPPRLPSKKQRSQSLTPSEVNRACQEKCNSADGVIQSPMMTRSAGADALTAGLKFSTHSLPRSSCNKMSLSPSTMTVGRNSKCISRVTSDPSLSPCAERRHFGGDDEQQVIADSPPPKPSRIPSLIRQELDITDRSDNGFVPHGCLQRVASYHASGSDSGNGSGDSAQSSAAGDPIEPSHKMPGVIIKNPRYNLAASESTATLKNLDFDYVAAEERLMQIIQPELNLVSNFDLENFATLLLPAVENKPLDNNALRSVRITLHETAPRILANHLTRVDFDIIFGEQHNDKVSKLNALSGIELCGLPIGHQLRMDLIERTECLKLLVAVTILTCVDDAERAETLNKWIEIAIDTKTALGNLFGFCGLMLGLCMPQIQKLNSTWHMLRQKHTDSAFNFEAKLRPTLKSMNECSNPQAPNTTIPHLLPLILLEERTLQDFIGANVSEQSSLITSCLSSWESHDQDFGLSKLLAHMEAARKYSEIVSTYRRNAEIVFGDCARTEELILDTFKTEFHMKFLWGSRGALVTAHERHCKFEQILTVMADRIVSEVNEGTPV